MYSCFEDAFLCRNYLDLCWILGGCAGSKFENSPRTDTGNTRNKPSHLSLEIRQTISILVVVSVVSRREHSLDFLKEPFPSKQITLIMRCSEVGMLNCLPETFLPFDE